MTKKRFFKKGSAGLETYLSILQVADDDSDEEV